MEFHRRITQPPALLNAHGLGIFLGQRQEMRALEPATPQPERGRPRLLARCGPEARVPRRWAERCPGRRTRRLVITLVLALVLLVSPSYLAGPAWAQGPDGKAVYYVAPGGDCGGQAPCFAALQAAVDAVDHRNDVIKVAAGTYGGVQTVGGLTQVVHIAKDLTLQGGYSRSDWETSDPARNETVIDALGQGRALVVDGARVTLQGLTFTGGDAMAGGSLDRYNRDLGGGLYLRGATVTLRHCQIRGNVAGSAENYLSGGGGLAATDSTLTLENCLITENVAAEAGQGQGGGMWLDSTVAQLTYTALISNTASLVAEGRGGGLYSDFGSLQMTDCEVRDNRAGLAGEWWTSLGGGGVYATNGEASFLDNTFRGNVGNYGEGLIDAYGGGLMVASVVQGRRLTISGNTFEDNIASRGGYGFGGGLSVAGYHAEISDNTFRHNIAGAFNGAGGGLHVGSDIVEPISYITITNNVFTDNIAADLYTGNGGGLFIGEIYDVGRNMAASVLVQNNQVRNNTASVQGFGAGGGITIGANAVEVKIYNNQIVANAAGRSSRESRGGGIFFMGSQGVVRDTLIQSNVASVDGLGRGGGVAVLMADVFLRRSVIDGNIASQTGEGEGGGVWCAGVWAAPGKTPTPIPVKLTNNMVTRNQA
ncbi:MAG: hypothetical protein H5T69_15275, partial [Chloroflexi bacterium]|nr:hypothetical protein [Chloroflexota bacterium]